MCQPLRVFRWKRRLLHLALGLQLAARTPFRSLGEETRLLYLGLYRKKTGFPFGFRRKKTVSFCIAYATIWHVGKRKAVGKVRHVEVPRKDASCNSNRRQATKRRYLLLLC